MKQYNSKLLLFLLIVLFASSCEKVIDIDLNSSDPKIVIEAEISDQSFCKVKLTQTVNFDESNSFSAVTGATVKITDNFGNTETLTETSAGNYIGSVLTGISGRTYTLEVAASDKTYKAISTIPQPVLIDTLLVEELFGHISGKVVEAKYTDPLGIKNFYRFILVVNSVDKKLIVITDDRLADGEIITQPIPAINEKIISYNTGDTAVVYLQSIDKGVYEYFRTLKQLEGGGHGGSTSPANPQSNIDNEALGYFNAYSVKSKSIIIN